MAVHLEKLIIGKGVGWEDGDFRLAGITSTFLAPLEKFVVFGLVSGLKRGESLSYSTSPLRLDHDAVEELWELNGARIRSPLGNNAKLVVAVEPAAPLATGSYTVVVELERVGVIEISFSVEE